MIQVLDQNKEKIVLLSGMIIRNAKERGGLEYRLMGYLYGTSEEIFLGNFNSIERIKGILLEAMPFIGSQSIYEVPGK